MVKVFLHLGWLVAFLVAVSVARPVHRRVYPPPQYKLILPAGDRSLHSGTAAPPADQDVADDGAVRSERSTNLSHITGSARKIQMHIKNRYLQILPDGTVNGTSNDGSDYSEYSPWQSSLELPRWSTVPTRSVHANCFGNTQQGNGLFPKSKNHMKLSYF